MDNAKETTLQLVALRKNNQTFVNIVTPDGGINVKEVYAILYGAVNLVAKQTGKSFEETTEILLDLDRFAKKTGQS